MFKENKDFKWSVIKDNFLTQDECDKLKYHIKNTRENLGEIPEGIKWNSILYNRGDDTRSRYIYFLTNKLFNVRHPLTKQQATINPAEEYPTRKTSEQAKELAQQLGLTSQ